MTAIACLGWGSLIWDQRTLRTIGPWNDDGPMIRVEFLRKSQESQCITLVLDEAAPPVRSLWTIMETTELDDAIENLREREDIPIEYKSQNIGRWRVGEPSPANIFDLPQWAATHNIDAVVWTALRHKFHKNKARPTVDDIAGYLAGLSSPTREKAEQYVRRAPPQIDTPYRRVIEARLGWTPHDGERIAAE